MIKKAELYKERTDLMAKKSTITLYRRIKLAQITSGKIDKIPKIAYMAFGSGGVDENGDPIMPSAEQTELNNEICRVPIYSVEFTEETTVKYTAILPQGQCTGEKINEFALIDEDGHLCAVQNTYTKQKDEDLTMTWEIEDQF